MLSSENSERLKQWLSKKPIRNAEWIEEEGHIKLRVKKFKSRLGIWLCRLFNKPDYFFVNFDEIGSFIWKHCDGKHSIEEILDMLEEKYGEEKMLERLYLFMKMLERGGYVQYEDNE